MKHRNSLALAAAMLLAAAAAQAADAQRIERGRYLLSISGCNDCHTPGYDRAAGKVPESEWLTGSPVGWLGPWGTSYPTNLRLRIASMTPESWLTYARHFESRPPMPYWLLHAMTDEDLLSMYEFVRELGPAGEEAPLALPPGVTPQTVYIDAHERRGPPALTGRVTRPEHVQQHFAEAYRRNDIEMVLALYEPDAVLVTEDGKRLAGHDAIRAALQNFFSLRGEFELEPLEIIEAGDLAVLISDWQLVAKNAAGKTIRSGGRTTDIVRRQPDGTWKLTVDNPSSDRVPRRRRG